MDPLTFKTCNIYMTFDAKKTHIYISDKKSILFRLKLLDLSL